MENGPISSAEDDFDFLDRGPPSPKLTLIPLSDIPDCIEPRLKIHSFSASFEGNVMIHFQVYGLFLPKSG